MCSRSGKGKREKSCCCWISKESKSKEEGLSLSSLSKEEFEWNREKRVNENKKLLPKQNRSWWRWSGSRTDLRHRFPFHAIHSLCDFQSSHSHGWPATSFMHHHEDRRMVFWNSSSDSSPITSRSPILHCPCRCRHPLPISIILWVIRWLWLTILCVIVLRLKDFSFSPMRYDVIQKLLTGSKLLSSLTKFQIFLVLFFGSLSSSPIHLHSSYPSFLVESIRSIPNLSRFSLLYSY